MFVLSVVEHTEVKNRRLPKKKIKMKTSREASSVEGIDCHYSHNVHQLCIGKVNETLTFDANAKSHCTNEYM